MPKVTINHNNRGNHLFTTTAKETTPTRRRIISPEKIQQLEVCMLNTQPTNLKTEFQAGKIKQHVFDYRHLTSDLETLQTLPGLSIELTDELVQIKPHSDSQ